MIQKTGVAAAGETVVETNGAARAMIIGRGVPYGVAATTGTIGAAAASGAAVFAMRLDPGSSVHAFIERIRLQFTTISPFTVPVTAGRRLELFRGSGAAPSAQTAIAAAPRKRSSLGPSQFDTAEGGDIRISNTAAMTVTGITFETVPFRTMSLVHAGATGAFVETLWEFAATESAPLQLEPGQLMAIRCGAAMDAGGTWQLAVNVDWHEAAPLP